MSVFRFRAQVALDLRRRELVTAQVELARVEQLRDQARAGVAKATAAVAGAHTQAAAQGNAPSNATELQWYRFWILRLDHERTTAIALLAARDRDVAEASAACVRARQRCESLERLREKAWRAYLAAEAEAERKLIDELATRRFSTARLAGARL